MVDIVIAEAGTLSADLLDAVLAGYGYRVHAAAPGHLAAAVVAHAPRLVLTEVDDLPGDVVLPAGTAVIVMSDDGRRGAVDDALRAGVRGYVHHSAGLDGLVDAVRRVEAGEVVVLVPTEHRARPAGPADVRRMADGLTTRELECLAMLVDGVGTAAITARLGISTLTVRSHVQSILSKLGVHSRLEAATLAVRHGLLESRGTSSRAG